MKCGSLGINLLKADLQKRAKFGGNPEITDMFLDRIELEDTEGKTPPEGDILIFHYSDRYHHLHSKYTINRNGEVKSLKGEIMKLFFHPKKRGPRVRIQIEKLGKNGEIISLEKEIGILQMMEQKFGIYIQGYKLKKLYPKDYMLVPKDGNYKNMRYNNLYYVCKDENTKKKLIKNYIQIFPNADDEKIANLFKTSQGYVRKARQELVDKGHISRFSEYQRLQREIGIEFSEDNFEIYKILIKTQGRLSNMEIAKLLRPEEIEISKNKSFYTNKIVRARKKLTDKGVISRFNALFESNRGEIVERIRSKDISGETNKQIAEAFGLKKGQIDNLARQIKKEKNKK